MADNTTRQSSAGGETLRTLDKTGTGAPKTPLVVLDVGGGDGRAETLLISPIPTLPDIPTDDDGMPLFSLSATTMDALGMLFRQLMAAASRG